MREVVAVIIGAIVGTGLRLGLDTLVPHSDSDFPVSTLVINIVGSFALGLFVARLWPRAKPWLKAGLGPGLTGSFTTFSAFAGSLVTLGAHHDWGTALVYLLVTVIAGGAAALAGLTIGGRILTRVDLENE